MTERDKLIGFAETGQVVFYSYILDLLQAGVPALTVEIFRKLQGTIPNTSMHTKPPTEGCLQAASVRVNNDLQIGVRLPHELKTRMFMAETIDGDPIIVLTNSRANFKTELPQVKALLPRDRAGKPLINLPHALSIKKSGDYDPLDEVSNGDSPYSKAANSLKLGMGQINPYAAMIMAERSGIKILCLYDSDLLKPSVLTGNNHLTTNAGHRSLGVFVEEGLAYVELAIANAKKLNIAGNEVPGAIVGDLGIVINEDKYKEPNQLGHVYRAATVFQNAVHSSWKR